ncbi:hypothetical protein GCK72_012168 [Caenorhabditis remanei]|uniref:Uncharacterized protein n=1 Tax=Caenorhabditis remanei TaxID=31234 RepID=A0A6A5GKA1_CAERE|nr:hypothetical protein GCK72_012168 [Caenorhabditis remanei]KAF1755718.1 hypothetical protein GCK72_012168 [Caenorhabditis remanei]
MKLPIPIGIPLLLLFAQMVYPAAIVVKRTTDAERNQVVDQVNELRAQMATAAKISNMHELSYDLDLERQAEALTCDSEPKGSFMVVVEPSQEAMAQLEKLSQEQQGQIGQAMMSNAIKAFFGPKQTRIGCAESKCPDAGGVCLIGPLTSVSERDFAKGEPGSNCPNEKTSNGLCRASGNNVKQPDAGVKQPNTDAGVKQMDVDVKQPDVNVKQEEGNSSTGFVFSTVSIIVSFVFYNFF